MKKATIEQIKQHNLRLVLKTIYDRQITSRAEIARLTHLTRTTVSDAVSNLINQGLVEEIGYGPSAGGTRPMLLRIVNDSRLLIGIDLANEEFRGALINLRGEIKYQSILPINGRKGEAAILLVFELIDQLFQAAQGTLLGIGIGTPGLMDANQGIIRNAVNLDWINLPLRKLLQEKYDLPIYIANDSQVAALGEFTFGTREHGANLIVVKISRGISAGIVLNNQIYYGDNYGAGEIGHVTVCENGEECGCGHTGCLETIVSSQSIVKHAQQIASTNPKSFLLNFSPEPKSIGFETVLKAFRAGDPTIIALINEAGYYLGKSLSNMVSILNIQDILIAGVMSPFGDAFLLPIRQTLKNSSLPPLAAGTHIAYASLGEDIVVLGAGAMLLANELGMA